MKNLILFFSLLIAVPSFAQSGLFGLESPLYDLGPTKQQQSGVLNKNDPDSKSVTRRGGDIGMDARDYEETVRIIKKESFDEARLNIAKRVITFKPMSTRQIVGICKLFTSEKNKLEFAKYAYFYCVDANKYSLLDDVFSFEDSKEELHEHIRH